MRNNDSTTKGDLQSLRDFIRQENRRLDNSINQKIEGVKSDVEGIKSDVEGIKSDVEGIKSDVEGVKSDVEGVKSDVKNLQQKTDALQQGVSNLIKGQEQMENKVDNLTDAVIEGFDNTERILSDWEGKPVDLISKEKKEKLKETA